MPPFLAASGNQKLGDNKDDENSGETAALYSHPVFGP
jgi:hypothetical protein